MTHRFRLVVDATGRGTLFDVNAGRPVDGVRAVAVVARLGEPTRVIVEYLAEAEVEVEPAVVEVAAPGSVEVVPPVRHRGPPAAARAAGGRARAAALAPERRSAIARQAARARWERQGRTRISGQAWSCLGFP